MLLLLQKAIIIIIMGALWAVTPPIIKVYKLQILRTRPNLMLLPSNIGLHFNGNGTHCNSHSFCFDLGLGQGEKNES